MERSSMGSKAGHLMPIAAILILTNLAAWIWAGFALGAAPEPVAAGAWFSPGHSTIVVIVTLAIALASDGARERLDGLKDAGGLLGTAVSVLFLVVLGLGHL